MTPNRISIACPHCDVVMKIRDEYAGKSIRCKNCRDVFNVPVYCERICPGCRETLRFRSVYLNYTVACRKCQAQFWLDPIDRRAASRQTINLGSSTEFSADPAVPSRPETIPLIDQIRALKREWKAAIADREAVERQLETARKALADRDLVVEKLRDRITAIEDERTSLANHPSHGQTRPPIDSEGTLLDAELLTMPLPGPAGQGSAFDPAEWRAELATARRNFESERAALIEETVSLRNAAHRERAEFDRERASFQERIGQADTQHASLRAENDALRAEIAQGQVKADMLRQQLTDLEAERDVTSQAHQEALARPTAELGEARRLIDKLSAKIRDAEVQRVERDRERASVWEQLEQTKARFAVLRDEARSHQSEKDALHAEVARHRSDANALHERLDQLKTQRDEADQAHQKALDDQKAELDEARRSIDARQAEVALLTTRLAEVEPAVHAVEDLRRQVDDLGNQLAAADRDRQEQITRHKADRDDQARHHDESRKQLEQQLAEARQTLDVLKAERDELFSRVQQVQADHADLELAHTRIREAEADRATVQKEADKLRRQVARLETDRMALTKLGDTLRERLENLQSQQSTATQASDSEHPRVRTRLWETERESQHAETVELRKRLAAIEVERAALIDDRDNQRRRSESLAAEQAAWQADRMAMEQRLQSAEAEIHRLKANAEATATSPPSNGDGDSEVVRELALVELERDRLEIDLERAEATIRQLREENSRKVIALPSFDDEDSFGPAPPPEPPRIAQLEKDLQASRATIEHLRSQLYGLGINATDGF